MQCSLAHYRSRAWKMPATIFCGHKLIFVQSPTTAAQPCHNGFAENRRTGGGPDLANRPRRSEHAVSASRNEVAGDRNEAILGTNRLPRRSREDDVQIVSLTRRPNLE